MHGEIAQHRERPAVARLNRDEGEIGVFGAGLARDHVPVASGVHVSAHGFVSKGILREAIGPPDPLAQGRKVRRVSFCETNARGFQIGVRRGDGLDKLLAQHRHIRRVRLGAQAAHRSGRAVRVRGGNEDAIRANAGALRRQGFRFIEQRAAHHATVHHHDCDLLLAIGQDQGPRVDTGLDLVQGPAEHAAIDEHRQFRRGDIHHSGPGFEFGPGRHHGEEDAGRGEEVEATSENSFAERGCWRRVGYWC